jgi:hypothetical protein
VIQLGHEHASDPHSYNGLPDWLQCAPWSANYAAWCVSRRKMGDTNTFPNPACRSAMARGDRFRILLGPFTAPVCFCGDIETGLRCGFRLVKMTILGIGLIICGLILICASAVFPWIVGRERSSQERLKRLDHHVRHAQRTPRDLDDKSEPAEHVPDNR